MFSLGFALMGHITAPLNLVERGLLLIFAGLVLTPIPWCIAAGDAILGAA